MSRPHGTIEIDGLRVGDGCPVYVIAEMSANHLGDFQRAKEIVYAAHRAGAHAIKLQTYTPDTMTIDDPDLRAEGTIWADRSLHDLYTEAQTPWEWHEPLFQLARDLGMHAFSSAFDTDSIDRLVSLGVPAIKIASSELVDLQLIAHAARTGLPIIMSTGMASAAEIGEAVSCLIENECAGYALLKCTAAYPALEGHANLAAIPRIAHRFGCHVGLSDHSNSPIVFAAAVALGARIVEVHVTLSRDDGGPDAAFSVEPDEFGYIVEIANRTVQALGTGAMVPASSEMAGRKLRRSLWVVADMRAGEPFTAENVRSLRPARGVPPRLYNAVLRSVASRDIAAGTPLSPDMWR